MQKLESEFGSKNIEYILSTSDSVQSAINESDLVVGSVYVVGKEAPKVVTKEMLVSMKPGTVMVDVSIDQEDVLKLADQQLTTILHSLRMILFIIV